MPIVQQGSINTTALVVPDLYVQIVPPQNLVLNGVPTNVVGVVGTASWGPVGHPVIVGTMADYAQSFGPIMARKYDMGTQVATAVQQGAQNFRCIRVTDNTDTAAQTILPATTVTFTALYTGSLGNQITLTLSTGSRANTWRLTVSLPGLQPEVYDNIAGTGAAVLVDLGHGRSTRDKVRNAALAAHRRQRGRGHDCAERDFHRTRVDDGRLGRRGQCRGNGTLVGIDIPPRSGMYALRGQGCGIAMLADADDPDYWTTQAGFGLEEGIYMILTGPAGDTIQNAVTVKRQAGLDSYAAKLMFGDWLWWSDQVNATIRLVSPQGFAAGRLANLSPEQSSLNKQLYSVIGSQKSGTPGSGQSASYSAADLAALLGAGIDVIATRSPAVASGASAAATTRSSNAATTATTTPA